MGKRSRSLATAASREGTVQTTGDGTPYVRFSADQRVEREAFCDYLLNRRGSRSYTVYPLFEGRREVRLFVQPYEADAKDVQLMRDALKAAWKVADGK
jgi:hypothetical protein